MEKWEERRDGMSEQEHCVWLSHRQRGEGGREKGTLLGIGNPLRRRRNPVVERGTTSSEKGQRRGSVHRESWLITGAAPTLENLQSCEIFGNKSEASLMDLKPHQLNSD